jgi:hypothetical protein
LTTIAFAVFISLITGILFSLLLYFKKKLINDKKAIFLFLVRLMVVSCLVFLILSPAYIQKKLVSEKQKIILAIDNSSSVALGSSTNQRKRLIDELKKIILASEKRGFEVICQTLDQIVDKDNLNAVQFDVQSTDLDGFLSKIVIQNDKVASVILVSDGIYNQGNSPIFNSQSFPIFTIGIGDTTQKKDAYFANNLYNETVGLDNVFTIVTNIRIFGFRGKSIKVRLKSKDKIIATKLQKIQNEDEYLQFKFQSSEKTIGFKQYRLEIEPLGGEFNLKNNFANIVFEVIEAKQRVLLAASVPHPDIKALKSTLEKNKNWEVETYIPQINTFKKQPYDLIILHQFPNQLGIGNDFLAQIIQTNSPKFFITGKATNYGNIASYLRNFQINDSNGSFDKVTGFLSNNFQRIEIGNYEIMNQLPPISVPFSEIYASNGWENVIYQQVGSTKTDKPILAINLQQQPFAAIFIGDGLWQWRMNEIKLTDKSECFDNFFAQIFQLLASKDATSNFTVKPTAKQFYAFERIYFKAELKNELDQNIPESNIEIKISDEKNKKYVYNFNKQDLTSQFEINGLPEGIYNYKAITLLNGKTLTTGGSFSIKSYDFENTQTKADFNLLRQMAKKSNGTFYSINTLPSMNEELVKINRTQTISINESVTELIELQWLMILLIVWITTEWFFRKRYYSV